MCKRHTMRTATVTQPYEGETIRLGAKRYSEYEPKAAGHCGGFPWWTLWLIWPLIGLLKASVPLLIGVVAGIGEITLPLVPLLLIVCGLLLLRRR
jgi:hypothetical protein